MTFVDDGGRGVDQRETLEHADLPQRIQREPLAEHADACEHGDEYEQQAGGEARAALAANLLVHGSEGTRSGAWTGVDSVS